MTAPAAVLELVQRFEFNRAAYHAGHYNETQLRREFLDPFFVALGWDVDNRQGYAEPYKDVIHEDALKIGGATKAPDYCFRIGGARKFFLEAKKPAVNLRDDVSAAYQLRRYAWSARLPLSILSDFEEFAVYDCRTRPDKGDKPAAGRILYLSYRDYPARWDEIAGVFAKEAILRGAFDRYAESATGKRGTAEVDAAFLAEIEGWRDTLARALALRNPGLTQRELNQAVQATIDRIIFLRIAEDRGIEGYGKLLALTNGGQIYARLTDLFREADARYNSGLFHFTTEADRPELADSLTLGLTLDDKPLKELLGGLYYPDSPYEFSVLPADILGQVYEQFLGKVIRLTPGHQAKVEDKPEVKKAGGVFYTPTYIVDAIVRRTVGALLTEKTPRDVAGDRARPPLRILDMACGSGSFLLGAYQYLLDWYLDRYLALLAPLLAAGRPTTDPDVRAALPEEVPPPGKRLRKPAPSLPIYQAAGGAWRLTTAERKRILLAHIYGVDIDPQAVEVTKLSLLLKVLEGESAETLGAQLRLFQERALPDLARNIKCGNSLIEPEFYDGQQLGLLDDEERYRINAFDWAAEFPEVFAAPRPSRFSETSKVSADDTGFDTIIGNPPYIRIQALKEWAPREVEYYKRAYASARKGNYDIYVVFVERALRLLNDRGRLGFILPHKFFNAQYGEPLRALLAQGRHLAEIVHFGDQQIFANATTYTCLLFLDRAGRDEFRFEKVTDLAAWRAHTLPSPAPAGRAADKPAPSAGHAPRDSGDTAPNSGEPSPNSGEAVPQSGEAVPQSGEAMPQSGEAMPQSGEAMPQFGETAPKLGEPSPDLGEASPASYSGSLEIPAATTSESPTCWGGPADIPNKLGTPARQAEEIPKTRYNQTPDPDATPIEPGSRAALLPAAGLSAAEWNFAIGAGAGLFEKLRAMPVKLGDIAERMAQGIRTSANEVYVLDTVSAEGAILIAHSKQLDRDVELERAAVSQFLQGREIKPYRILPCSKVVVMPYRTQAGRAELIPETELRHRFPKVWEYLRANKVYLENREKGRFRGAEWHGYGRVQNIDLMLQPKILVPDIADRASFALDEAGEYAFTSGYGITFKSSVAESPKYILGLLNSKILDYYLKQVSTTMRGGFFRYFTQFIEQLPIRPIAFTDPADRGRHDRLVALVETMLALHRQLAASKTSHEQAALQRQLAATDRQIDRLVYALYELTEREITIVEDES